MSEASKPHSIADDFKIVRNAIADFGGPGPWDAAYHSLNYIEEQLKATHNALAQIAVLQDNALRYIETNDFVFDDIGTEPGNWKHLAFSLYTDLCQADTLAHQAIDVPLGVRPGSNPASEPKEENA